jgi:hypothetical protein
VGSAFYLNYFIGVFLMRIAKSKQQLEARECGEKS